MLQIGKSYSKYLPFPIIIVNIILFFGLLLPSCNRNFISSYDIASEKSPPSFILILLDACRANHISSYGYGKNTTPNIDKLAQGGIIYFNHYSQCDGTVISTSQLMLGRFIVPNILVSQPAKISPESETAPYFSMPSILGANGYTTSEFTGHPYFSYKDSTINNAFQVKYDIGAINSKSKSSKTCLKEINEYFLPWLQGQGKKPFFVYLHAMDTHFPHPLRTNQPHFIDNKLINLFETGIPQNHSGEGLTENEKNHIINLYDEDLYNADLEIGKIIRGINENINSDNIVLIITADHGDQLYDNNMIGHGYGNLRDFETHIPLIIYSKKIITASKIKNKITRTIDLAPTILSLAGIETPNWFLGEPLLIKDSKGKWKANQNYLGNFAPTMKTEMLDDNKILISLRGWDYKFIFRNSYVDNNSYLSNWVNENITQKELFDLNQDPKEFRNKQCGKNDPRWEEAQMIWENLLKKHFINPIPQKNDNQEILNRLKTLGYIK